MLLLGWLVLSAVGILFGLFSSRFWVAASLVGAVINGKTPPDWLVQFAGAEIDKEQLIRDRPGPRFRIISTRVLSLGLVALMLVLYHWNLYGGDNDFPLAKSTISNGALRAFLLESSFPLSLIASWTVAICKTRHILDRLKV